MSGYFKNIGQGASSLLTGLKLTFRHLFNARKKTYQTNIESDNYFERQNGIFTLQYPHESLPVPDNGRYRLHNEIDDCIVCDLCAKVCPVDCITIDAIRSPEEIGKTSDGSTKRLYAGKFDIDMAKCCYCGLCTTVCPTECLTMTKSYDFPEFDIRNMIYHFSDLTPEEAEQKRQIFEESQRIKTEMKKAAEKAKAEEAPKKAAPAGPKVGKPVIKPVIKPVGPKPASAGDTPEKKEEKPKAGPPKPIIKPVIKPKKDSSE